MADRDELIIDEEQAPQMQNDLIFDEPEAGAAGQPHAPQQETTVNQAGEQETVFNEALKETTFNEQVKETTFNEQTKETTFNQATKETTVNEPQKKPTPPKQEENNEEEDKDGAEINNQGTDNHIGDPDMEKGPFKEDDIIKYMYTDWLIGGLNWLWAKGAQKIKGGMMRQQYKQSKKGAQDKKKRTLERYDTYKLKEKYNNKMLKELEDKEKKLSSYNGLVELCDKIRAGRMDETKLSDETKALIKAMPKKDFDAFFNKKRIQKLQENIKDNMIAAMQFANMYAQTAVLEAKMQNLNHDLLANGNDAALAAMKQEGLLLYVKSMTDAQEKGKNTAKFSEQMLKKMQKALNTTHKNIDNGRFDGFEKEKRNKIRFWKKETVKGEYQPNEDWNAVVAMLQNIDTKRPPANMMEEAIIEQDFDKASNYQFEQYQQQNGALGAQQRQLDNRRKQLENVRARIMSDPARRAEREAKEADRAVKRQAMIDRMRQDPNYGNPALRQRLLGGGR